MRDKNPRGTPVGPRLNIVIVLAFYSPSYHGQRTAKGPCGFRVELQPVCNTKLLNVKVFELMGYIEAFDGVSRN